MRRRLNLCDVVLGTIAGNMMYDLIKSCGLSPPEIFKMAKEEIKPEKKKRERKKPDTKG